MIARDDVTPRSGRQVAARLRDVQRLSARAAPPGTSMRVWPTMDRSGPQAEIPDGTAIRHGREVATPTE